MIMAGNKLSLGDYIGRKQNVPCKVINHYGRVLGPGIFLFIFFCLISRNFDLV